jgi:hypothetical protein
MRRLALALALALALPLLLLGCHSAGQYGFSRSYQALSAEQAAAQGTRDYDPVMAARDKDDWKKGAVSLFGVVKARSQSKDGSAYLTLSMRTLSERNLCDDFDEDTCRVTVSEHEHAVVHANLKLASEDDIGAQSVGKGSLVRVIGKLTDEVDPDDGTPVLRASYYRHWPRNFFVTTADSAHMQR